MNICPICGYNRLEFPPENYTICACCGTEFDYDDRVLTHEQLTREWVRRGFPWFDQGEPKPEGWNPYLQLLNARLGWAIAPAKIIVSVDPTRIIPAPPVQIEIQSKVELAA